ncbi:ABC transporter substrate-binding protein [Kibdelosporangium persicum]|uniref:ABC-type branched-subunit amino acid transport system substrate-binding protein n=1 Tax=Kibdelosporangium persicum TaxID=2698649 RepID=A0ABX2FJ92_9PSEU|nr:ABC transporter substrate-binding protein [Kibdelosporangium persicum]NRN70813.1 ABC-type branched-subunit amino acid transport system substrate-binding protein [Kibdelosporangium persicum]
MTASSSRYIWWLLPRRGRFPKRWTDWIRLGLVATLLLIAATAGLWGPVIVPRRCSDGFWPDADIWEAGNGECVGLSEGAYSFGVDAFAPVMQLIDRQNQAAAEKCAPNGTPVTVGVLMTMTDRFAGSRAVHELEGMATAQRVANDTGCLHPMRLLVGQIGQYGAENTPAEVARRIAQRPEVVAVAGIGLSHQYSADVADILAGAKIPMVSDLITAEGFDQTGSRDDKPNFDGCDENITYPRGIGRDYFYRVAFRNSQQISQLGAVAPGRPDFIMVPTGGSDPYTCTTLPFMQRQFGGNITEVKFDADELSTVGQTAKRVCSLAKDVIVAYIARGRDLGPFLNSLDEAYSAGQCSALSVTVLSTSDGNRLRAAEHDPRLEDFRVKALRSPSFATGKVRLLAALVAGADRPMPGNPNFDVFAKAFTDAGFDITHADAGWAVNAYDALTTIAEALRTLPSNRPVQRSGVNTVISGFTSREQSVPGAGGLITFDNSGNRTDTQPPVIRLCPMAPGPADKPARTTATLARPGVPADCP